MSIDLTGELSKHSIPTIFLPRVSAAVGRPCHRPIRFQSNCPVEDHWTTSSASRLSSRRSDKRFSYGEQKKKPILRGDLTHVLFGSISSPLMRFLIRLPSQWEKATQAISPSSSSLDARPSRNGEITLPHPWLL